MAQGRQKREQYLRALDEFLNSFGIAGETALRRHDRTRAAPQEWNDANTFSRDGSVLRGYPETFPHCRNEIKQLPCGNETRGDHRERVCSA